jgi:hypothetical protein
MIDDDTVRAIDAALRVFGDEIAKAAAANGDPEVAALASGRRALWEMFADGYLALDDECWFRPADNRAERRMLRRQYAPLVARYYEMVRRGAFEPLKDAAA